MFEQLIESNHKKKSSLSQTVISLALHAGVIFGAVKATQGVIDGPKDVVVDTTMIFMKAPEAPPPPPPPPENVVVSANPPPQGFQVITPPDNIPTEIPPVNLNERFDPKDFTGKGVEGGIASGIVGGTGPVPTIDGDVYLAAEVEDRPEVADASKCQPAYPPVMQSAGIPGKVVMQFVVNTDGKVDPTQFKVISSTHKAFEGPAKEAMLGCTFKPGKSRGQPVRVMVQQSLSFKLGS